MAFPIGILPDAVIRDPRAEAWLVFADLAPELDSPGAQEWLRHMTKCVATLTTPRRRRRFGNVAVGLGSSFFAAGGQPRFGIEGRMPRGLQEPPKVAVPDTAGARDVLFYVMTTSEAAGEDFLMGLSDSRKCGLRRVTIERGFQRTDRRELGGFLDGLRNVPRAQRRRAVFLDRDFAPDEPAWCEDGTYLAYLKIRQDLERWAAIPVEEQERIMGRRKTDGSRLDLPAGTNPRSESAFTSDAASANSHVRKSGPRGEVHDRTAIFRRGVPYLTLTEDVRLDGGLQFVSFQQTLDAFDALLNRWMLNTEFPTAGAGPDRLFGEGLASVLKAGFYFVPPRDSRFIGASVFDAPRPERKPRKATPGRLIVRKRAINPDGTPATAELGSIGFQVFRADTNEPVGGVFTTDSAGHAVSPDLPRHTDLILREVSAPAHLEPLAERRLRLEQLRELVRLDNRVRGPGYR